MKAFAFAVLLLAAAPAAAQEPERPKTPRPGVGLDFVQAAAAGGRVELPGTRVERTLKTATWRGVTFAFGFDTRQFRNPRSHSSDPFALAAKAGRSVQGRALLTVSW